MQADRVVAVNTVFYCCVALSRGFAQLNHTTRVQYPYTVYTYRYRRTNPFLLSLNREWYKICSCRKDKDYYRLSFSSNTVSVHTIGVWTGVSLTGFWQTRAFRRPKVPSPPYLGSPDENWAHSSQFLAFSREHNRIYFLFLCCFSPSRVAGCPFSVSLL